MNEIDLFLFDKCLRGRCIIFNQWRQIHREPQLILRINHMGVIEGRIRTAAAYNGLYHSLYPQQSARAIACVQFFSQFGIGTHIKRDLIFRLEPVEITPNFTAIDLLWARVGRNLAALQSLREIQPHE